MEKLDFKATDTALYGGKPGRIDRVDVPPMMFLMIDGQGDPNSAPAYSEAVQALYGMSYGLKFHAKAALGRDHVVGPLEGLWWAEDFADFTANRRAGWRWTMMIRQPDWITEQSVAKVQAGKGILAPLRLARLAEGACLQTLYLGPYAEEGPVIARLHAEIAAQGLRPTGHHHEIYLGDPRKVAPQKLKTILRQPVGP
ncbi:MAG: GyrI-like domain-containing protein [Rhodobacteraceae bacterium]|nr:GyrI-like domain-containing protein [Paracoccaceae bacterium]